MTSIMHGLPWEGVVRVSLKRSRGSLHVMGIIKHAKVFDSQGAAECYTHVDFCENC